MIEAIDIHVTGIVQGVGFRPFVYTQAKHFLINGWVLNTVEGVDIHAEGERKLLDEFTIAVADKAPAAAQVKQLDIKDVPLQDCEGFEIRFSDTAHTDRTTLVSPDLATCDDCIAELFDPKNRRYRYPFINCTNCGPRFTIIKALPYDRANTTMSDFTMCDPCAHEYADPANRRFHAQPDACFTCGPQLTWFAPEGSPAAGVQCPAAATNVQESDAIIAAGVDVLRSGGILALKGLGGFHLVCDAANPQAMHDLRQRKHRPNKPFAVMVSTVEQAREYCHVSVEEEALMKSAARPIVLLRKRADVQVAEGLADGLPELGIMLPATPVQHLLLHDFGGMVVMTSGNVHDDPIQTDDAQAHGALAGIADAFIGNNRAIENRYDDSVARVIDAADAGCAVQFIRRARGYAPLPLTLGSADEQGEACDQEDGSATQGRQVFATGPEQKNTFTYVRGADAFVSQHMGDMESVQVYDAWQQARESYGQLFDLQPEIIACDMHPEYLTTKWACSQPTKPYAVQHHHAHIAAVMAENNLEDAVCGIAFDGTGYGADGRIWGGEVLLANLQAYERFANFAYFPLPGGAAAIKNPLRCAYGALWAFDLLDHPAAQAALAPLGDQAQVCNQMIESGLNCPLTSSVGRLFDAASALLGVCTQPTYEGEGAVLLEAAMTGAPKDDSMADAEANEGNDLAGATSTPEADFANDASAAYHIEVTKNTATKESTAQDTSVVLFDAAPVFKALLDDIEAGVAVPVIARRFHDAIVGAVIMSAQLVQAAYGITTVALGGGVFMNRYITQQSLAALQNEGFTVAINNDLPPNDACVSFGQAVVALHA